MMQRRNAVRTGMMLGALLLGGGLFSQAHADEAKVTVDNFAFTPAEVTVAAGTKVTWVNHDDIPHTVTDAADKREFKSPALDTDDTFSFVFSKPGTYRYFCSLHPHMQGVVVVK